MKYSKGSIDYRMKEFYENRTRYSLPRRTYTIIRIDGKAFHTYTKGLEKPFDKQLVADMDETACYLCNNIQGAEFAFVQSDEISILLTDFKELDTDAWFDGNIQKIVSVSASLATAKFNDLRPGKLALFDSRVFTIPSAVEVNNYFIWRQQDAIRNSILSLGQSMFSHHQLENKNTIQIQEMCFQEGMNWSEFPARLKRGRLIVKQYYKKGEVIRSRWTSLAAPVFDSNQELLKYYIPKLT